MSSLDKNESLDENVGYQVIHQGKNEFIDKIIDFLQKSVEQQRFKFPHAKIGGEDGMKITRAAFATLLKYRDLQDDFNYIVETVELEGQVT